MPLLLLLLIKKKESLCFYFNSPGLLEGLLACETLPFPAVISLDLKNIPVSYSVQLLTSAYLTFDLPLLHHLWFLCLKTAAVTLILILEHDRCSSHFWWIQFHVDRCQCVCAYVYRLLQGEIFSKIQHKFPRLDKISFWDLKKCCCPLLHWRRKQKNCNLFLELLSFLN